MQRIWRILAILFAWSMMLSAHASEVVCIPMHPRMIASIAELPPEVIDILRSARSSYDKILDIGSPFKLRRNSDGPDIEEFRLEEGAIDGDCIMASVKSSANNKPVQTVIFSHDSRGWRMVAKWDIELHEWLNKAGVR